jgi:PKD repeat protein
MRTLILIIALLLASLILRAQDSIPQANSCKARFAYSVNTEIMTFAPATVLNFFDLSEGGATNWFWDFGDGYTSYDQNPVHIFNHPMTKPVSGVPPNPYRTVTLTISTADSCISHYSETINIFDQYTEPDPRCKAEFKHYTLLYDSIAGTETFQFSNRSEGDSLSYLWLFDDGSTSTDVEPTFTYDFSEPMHKVSLTITSSDGCNDTYGEDVFMSYAGGGTSDPGDSITYGCFVAFGYTINYDIQTYAAALVLDFYTKSDDAIVSWNWDFGDGSTDTIPDPTHIFNYPVLSDSIMIDPNSVVNVCLTVTTASGCVSSYCQLIDIYTGTTPHETYCHPWFKGYVPYDMVTIPEVVPFQFANGSEGDVVSCLWQFEDGTTSTEREPLVMFDFYKPTQYVCLTITTFDSCTSTWCETIYVSPPVIDTSYVIPVCNYTFNYTSYYPEWASACIGTATAQVVLNDSIIPTVYYYWITGTEGQSVDGPVITNLCPTEKYTVTALTTDGCKFSGSFIFNSDGSVTEIPVNWWIYGYGDDSYVEYNINNSDYSVEWVLCDGTIVEGDSILLSEIDCGTNEANLLLKDAMGNVVYRENVALKADLVSNKVAHSSSAIEIYPVPVNDVLNISFNNKPAESIRFEISDLSGRTLLKQNLQNVKTGQRFSINVSALQKGIYLGKIISGNHIVAVEKFSK